MEIRPARRDDELALIALDEATISPIVSPSPPPSARADYPGFWRAHEEPADTLVAEIECELAGYVKLSQATELEASRHVLLVAGLAVGPAHQAHGVGRALMEAAINEAKARGARRLTLRVLEPNERARKLYESLGFEVEGIQREEFFLEGRYVDDVLMALTLTPRS